MIDAARPYLDARKAAPVQFVAHRRRRHHHDGGGRVKPAQRGIGPALGHQRARRDIFGKARVIAGGEDAPVRLAIVAGGEADRPFCRNVDMIGLQGVDAPRHGAPGSERQLDVGVGRQGNGAKALRRQEIDLRALPARGGRHLLERMHDAVDLRAPRVGGDENAHQAAFASASTSCGVCFDLAARAAQ